MSAMVQETLMGYENDERPEFIEVEIDVHVTLDVAGHVVKGTLQGGAVKISLIDLGLTYEEYDTVANDGVEILGERADILSVNALWL